MLEASIPRVHFVITSEEANVILASLAELPAKQALPLIEKLQRQLGPPVYMPWPKPSVETVAEIDFAV